MRWEVHVVCVGEGRGIYRVLVENPEGKRQLGRERDHLVDSGLYGRIILRRIFRKWNMGVWT
jgi:hypothetical protein